MATDEDVYLEAVESLDRIGHDNELPGDRKVVRNVLEAFSKLRAAPTRLALVAKAMETEAAQLSGLIRLAKATAYLQQELENILSEQQQRITALGSGASGRTPAKPG